MGMLPMIIIIVAMFYLMWRGQSKERKKREAMLSAIKNGDRVVTIGGIHGTVVSVKDQTVVIKVDDSARIEFSKNAISTVSSRNAEKTAPKKEKTEVLENGGEAGSIQGAAPAAEENKEDK